MKCPGRKTLVEQDHVGWSVDDEEYDRIGVEITCVGCDKVFFVSVQQDDFVSVG